MVDLPEPVGPVTSTRPERMWPNSLTTVGHAECFERGDLGGNQPEHGGEAVLLFEVVAAEARVLVHLVGEVEVAGLEVAFEGAGLADFARAVAGRSRRRGSPARGWR